MDNTTLYNLNYNVPKGKFIEMYRQSMIEILSRLVPEYNLSELYEVIDYAISNTYQESKADVYNNRSNAHFRSDLLGLTNFILDHKPILTTQGVLFKRHDQSKNPFYNFIQYLLDKRDAAKKMMKKFEKGTEEYNKWNLMQLNYKVATNGAYGCIGQFTSFFYNLHVCTAVTGAGRGAISAAICMFEGLLANNMKFGSLTEILEYITNVDNDIHQKSLFNDYDVLDRNITPEECLIRLVKSAGWKSWVPSNEATEAIYQTLLNLDQKTINVLYYKNNLYEFCSNTRVRNLIMEMLISLKEPFLKPQEPPEEIKNYLTMFKDLIYEYVYYRHLWFDKLERVYLMIRDVVLITDTDSCIISLDEWYKFVLAMTVGVQMNIKYTQAEIVKAADKLELELKKTEPQMEYDFYNDELVEAKRRKYPLLIIEEDNLRYSIVDIMSYVVSELIIDYMELYSECYNTASKDRDCLLIMKNEFLFKSLLLTNGAKNYADIQLVQEGKLIPEDQQLDIKGMPISKIGIPESTSTALKNIIEYDILRNSFVDQVDIFRKLVILEKQIYQSIKSKSKEFHKPVRIKSMSNYKLPMSIQGIKAAFAYNSIKDKSEKEINLNERNTVLIIKVNINKKTILNIARDYPEYYTRIKALMESEEFKKGIDAIAIPETEEIPSWIVPLINYVEIIHDNLRSFPLDEIGMSKNESKNVMHTNIIKF